MRIGRINRQQLLCILISNIAVNLILAYAELTFLLPSTITLFLIFLPIAFIARTNDIGINNSVIKKSLFFFMLPLLKFSFIIDPNHHMQSPIALGVFLLYSFMFFIVSFFLLIPEGENYENAFGEKPTSLSFNTVVTRTIPITAQEKIKIIKDQQYKKPTKT